MQPPLTAPRERRVVLRQRSEVYLMKVLLRASVALSVLLLASCTRTDANDVTGVERAQDDARANLAVPGSTNLIANAGLETAATSTTPANWSPSFWGSTPSFSYPVSGRSGRGATVVQSANSTGDARWQHASVSVTPGARYTYSGLYRSTASTSVIPAFTSASGALTYNGLATPASSSGRWTQYSTTFTVPAGIARMTVYHAISRAGSLTIDDVSLTQVDAPPPPPTGGQFMEGMVSLTFDDAWESQYINALPILQSTGIKGTFYLTTVPIQQGWQFFMTPAAVRDLAAKGHEIAGHTLTHPDLNVISSDSVRTEVTASRAYLQTLTGASVTSFAYPFGNSSPTTQTLLAAAGYTSGRTVAYTAQNLRTTNPFALSSMCVEPTNTVPVIKAQIDAAMANRTWFILCFHDVKTGGDNLSITPANFREIVDYLRARGTRVVTVAQGRALMGL